MLVSTNSPTAALLGKWLRPGLSVFGVGRPNEFDDDVYLRADLISVTSKTHELGYYDTKLDQPLIRLSAARDSSLGITSRNFAIFLPAKLPCRILPSSIDRVSRLPGRLRRPGVGGMGVRGGAEQEDWDRRSAPNKGRQL